MTISAEEKVFFMPIRIFAYKTKLKHDQEKKSIIRNKNFVLPINAYEEL
jgi:hypothetical protein